MIGVCVIEHFADRLLAGCREKGSPICVGLDPVFERLSAEFRDGMGPAEAIYQFSHAVMHVVASHVPCVKIQSACFERYHAAGVEALYNLIDEAGQLGLIVINDAKRGDIGISASHYAAGCLADYNDSEGRSYLGPDALTINSYLGRDGIEPFVDVATREHKGLFALVRTSNPGGDAIQSLEVSGDAGNVASVVGSIVADLGRRDNCVGQSGYSLLGAVVGATKAQDAAHLRKLMPQQIFLVPGFGAQGGGADDVRACFHDDGTGAIVTASRSILYAYEKSDEPDWRRAIELATIEMKRQVNAALA